MKLNNRTGRFEESSVVSPPERYFLGNALTNLVEKNIKEKKVTQNEDWMFGTSLI